MIVRQLFSKMKLPELTLGVSLSTFGTRDTAARPFGRIIAAYELLKNLRSPEGGTPGLASTPALWLGYSPKFL